MANFFICLPFGFTFVTVRLFSNRFCRIKLCLQNLEACDVYLSAERFRVAATSGDDIDDMSYVARSQSSNVLRSITRNRHVTECRLRLANGLERLSIQGGNAWRRSLFCVLFDI